jgi:hypothetical protein
MDTVIDPIKVPVITLSQAELEDIQAMIDAGQLPGDFLDRHHEAVRKNVFGHDFKTDRHGDPIEQGRGSAVNMTQQSVDAYKKWGRDEPDFAANLQRMEEQLAGANARRKAQAPASRRGVSR